MSKNLYWTSKRPINGLRHFVLIHENEEKGEKFFTLVSVLDEEINLRISENKFKSSGNWLPGWKNLSHEESITKKYFKFKSSKFNKRKSKLFISDESVFNIS